VGLFSANRVDQCLTQTRKGVGVILQDDFRAGDQQGAFVLGHFGFLHSAAAGHVEKCDGLMLESIVPIGRFVSGSCSVRVKITSPSNGCAFPVLTNRNHVIGA
jgi:hypothetical protein